MPAGDDPEVEASAVPCTDRLRRFSGPIVYGLECGVRRRTASRWSRALPLAEEEEEEEDDGEEVAAAIAIARVEEGAGTGGGEKRGGDDES